MQSKLQKIVAKNNIIKDADLSKICSFGIGGKADYLIYPKTITQLTNLIKLFNNFNIKYKVVGACSNLLFCGDRYNGVIICTKKLNKISLLNGVYAQAGASLPILLNVAQNSGLSGLEFLVGVPATVGGAVVNNAGAFKQSISDVILDVTYFDGTNVITKTAIELGFGYRTSVFLQNKNLVVLGVRFKLSSCNVDSIKNKMINYLDYRISTQPKQKSAGSVFKAYNNISAGYLIDKAGLKGVSCGSAEISKLHANFIVNNNNATSKDVIYLINLAKNCIIKKYGIRLSTEIELVD